jgi:hypothetical protein
MAIKVSAKTVAQLRKGTMAGNLAKAKNASPEMKEALVRFYGAKRVNAATGASAPKASVKTPSAKRTGGMTVKSKSAPSAATRMDKPKAKATGMSSSKPKSSFAPSGRKSTPVERGYEKVYKAATSQGTKPFVDVPAGLSSAQKKMKDKAKANAELYAKQQKAAQDKKKKK